MIVAFVSVVSLFVSLDSAFDFSVAPFSPFEAADCGLFFSFSSPVFVAKLSFLTAFFVFSFHPIQPVYRPR